jgi:hypothetical protein
MAGSLYHQIKRRLVTTLLFYALSYFTRLGVLNCCSLDKKGAQKIKHGMIAPRIRAGQRLPIA